MASFSYLQTIQDTANLTTYTQSGANLGAADADRYIILGITARKAGAATTITSVTIGGVSATVVGQYSNSDGNSDICGIAIANVPTGTTGDVVVTFGSGMVRAVFTMWRAVGYDMSSTFDFQTDGSTDPSVSINTPAGGILVATALTNSVGTCTWTGATEHSDATLETYVTVSDASDGNTTADTGRTVTANFTSSGSTPVMAVASWEVAAGSTDTNDERNAEVTGQDTANASRDAEISGSIDANASRDAEVTGSDTANAARDAEVTGQETSNAERDAEITGIADNTWEIQRNDDGAGWVTIETGVYTDPYSYVDTGPFTSGVEYCYRVRNLTDGTSWSNTDCVTYVPESTDAAAERDAEVTGQSLDNAERSAEIHGKSTDNAARDAEIVGSSTSFSTREAEISGQNTDNASRSAEITGVATDNAERDAEVTGADSATANRDAEVTGALGSNAERDAEVTGVATDNAERDAEVTGALGSNDERDAEVSGEDAATDERDAEVTGQDSDNAERGAEVTGADTANDEVNAEVTGADTANAARDAEIQGEYAPDTWQIQRNVDGAGWVDLEEAIVIADPYSYVDSNGPFLADVEYCYRVRNLFDGTDWSNIDCVTYSTDQLANAERDAEISGVDTDNAERAAEIRGGLDVTAERDAEITGQTSATADRNAEITGVDTDTAERAAEITGSESATSSRDAEISGIGQAGESRNAAITGDGGDAAIRDAEITGQDTANAERAAEITGGIVAAGDRAAEITGEAGAGGNIKYWDGTQWVVKPVKYWDGTQWVVKPLKYWDGTQWVTTPY